MNYVIRVKLNLCYELLLITIIIIVKMFTIENSTKCSSYFIVNFALPVIK